MVTDIFYSVLKDVYLKFCWDRWRRRGERGIAEATSWSGALSFSRTEHVDGNGNYKHKEHRQPSCKSNKPWLQWFLLLLWKHIHVLQKPSLDWLIDYMVFNPFPHNDTFWHPWETSLLKTQWEKEKLLVTSNFSFSHSVFNPFEELYPIFVKLKIDVCKLYQLWGV